MLRMQNSVVRNALRPALVAMRRSLAVSVSRSWMSLGPARSAKWFEHKNLTTVRFMSTDDSKEKVSPDPDNTASEAQAKTNEPPKETEKVVGDVHTHGFKAETRQLLDIVAKSLYHDKEVFVRELVSNASDALEKARYLSAANAGQDLGGSLEIKISVNTEEKTFTIQDNGVGMNQEELMENLGTIARSGSKAFLNEIASNQSQADVAKSIIGKFGVGFYRSCKFLNAPVES